MSKEILTPKQMCQNNPEEAVRACREAMKIVNPVFCSFIRIFE